MFRHPNYYKKLRASLKKEAISPDDASTDEQGRTPKAASDKQQAASDKLQAASDKLQALGKAASSKR